MHTSMRHHPTLALALLFLVEASTPAHACSLVGNGSHQLDPAHESDAVAPSEATLVDYTVHRYEDDAAIGCVAGCGEYGVLTLDLEATDNATPRSELGFQLRVVGGELPRGLTLPDEALAGSGSLYLYFDFDAPAFEVELEARAVDLNGNLGPPITFTVANGRDDGGCAVRSGRGPTWLVVAAAALVAVRRRRARG